MWLNRARSYKEADFLITAARRSHIFERLRVFIDMQINSTKTATNLPSTGRKKKNNKVWYKILSDKSNGLIPHILLYHQHADGQQKFYVFSSVIAQLM